MPVLDHDRERVVREIVRSAAEILGRPAEVLSVGVHTEPGGSVRAEVRGEPGDATWLRAVGDNELEALAALLSRVVDRANATEPQLAMTPALERAIALLQMSREELERAVREEIEGNPVGARPGERGRTPSG